MIVKLFQEAQEEDIREEAIRIGFGDVIVEEKDEPNTDVIVEEVEKTKDKNHFRTDMSINIKSNKIVIEYLEKQHEKEKNLDYPFEKYRAFNLMFDNKNPNNQIVHIAYNFVEVLIVIK